LPSDFKANKQEARKIKRTKGFFFVNNFSLYLCDIFPHHLSFFSKQTSYYYFLQQLPEPVQLCGFSSLFSESPNPAEWHSILTNPYLINI